MRASGRSVVHDTFTLATARPATIPPMNEATSGRERLGGEVAGGEIVAAMLAVWGSFWSSRALIWVAGLAALALFGAPDDALPRLDIFGFTTPFESDAINALLAPAARWDSAHYLEIARFGYADSSATAFFPLYPLLIAAGGAAGGSLLIGVGLSIVAALGGLLVLHRLVALDFGEGIATATVAIVAWYPGSLAFSGVYTESLFLLLSVGAVFAGRQGRWALAGSLGALAAATRSGGVLVAVALLALYLWGPRADRPPSSGRGPLRIRYRLGAEAAWIALVPAGVIAYALYLGIATGDPMAFVAAQGEWERVAAPLAAIPLALLSALQGLTQFLPGVGPDSLLAPAGPHPAAVGLRNVAELGFLALALWLLLESARRLPFAYTAYAAVALALPLSVPALDEPLKSLPRFMAVIFPLWIALALWAGEEEPRRMRRVLTGFGALLVVFAGLFTTWVQAP